MSNPVITLHLPAGARGDLFGPNKHVLRDHTLVADIAVDRGRCRLRTSGSYEIPLGKGHWLIAGAAEMLAEREDGTLDVLISTNFEQAQRLRVLRERLEDERKARAA